LVDIFLTDDVSCGKLKLSNRVVLFSSEKYSAWKIEPIRFLPNGLRDTLQRDKRDIGE
jgi:hypothetical protein